MIANNFKRLLRNIRLLTAHAVFMIERSSWVKVTGMKKSLMMCEDRLQY